MNLKSYTRLFCHISQNAEEMYFESSEKKENFFAVIDRQEISISRWVLPLLVICRVAQEKVEHVSFM